MRPFVAPPGLLTRSAEPQARRVHLALGPARERLAARDGQIVGAQMAVSEIAAPTGDEGQRASWIADRFRALGLCDVRTDAVGNVVGRRAGAELELADRPVVVCAHLDTVFPNGTALRVRRDGRRLIGPGIGDNGRGLAAMLALAEEIDGVALRSRHPIDFVATTGEEGLGDLRGAKHFFTTLPEPPAAALALDGAGDERIVHRALGSRRYRATFRGPGGHSWAAFGVPNAVHAAAGAAAKLAALPLVTEPRTTLSVGRIGGGISVNVIPGEAWIEVDLRSVATHVIERFDREVRRCVFAAVEEENGRRALGTPLLTCEITLIGDRPCGEISPDDPLVRAAMHATRLVGREPELATASTDANVPISLGIPAIAIGAGGRGGNTHTPTEWFDNTDGTLGLARALTILLCAADLVA
jgi:acetylornithine deacetylase/succinyl-diaminopimelate desuccinylase-like protein